MWKLLGYLVVVFWSYLEAPSSHILRNKNKITHQHKYKNHPDHPSLLSTHVGLYVYYELPIDRTAAVML